VEGKVPLGGGDIRSVRGRRAEWKGGEKKKKGFNSKCRKKVYVMSGQASKGRGGGPTIKWKRGKKSSGEGEKGVEGGVVFKPKGVETSVKKNARRWRESSRGAG